MRFVGRGHRAIRATHGKTLELVAEAEVTERGTCIVAVSAEAEPPAPMAGPVRIRISAGDRRHSLTAIANPLWTPGDAMVIRRGPLRLPGTFATDADSAASDLPRDLVEALQDPDTLVIVDVAPAADEQPAMVLFAAGATHGPDAALRAELDRADLVIAEDSPARRLVGGRAGRGEATTGRTLVVATRDLPGATLPERPATARVDTVGLPSVLAAAAACPSRAPLTLGADLDSTSAAHRLVVTLRTRGELQLLLRRAEKFRGTGRATVVQDFGRPLEATPDDIPDLAGAEAIAVCLHPAPPGEALDPRVRATVDGLLADGSSTRTAAAALATLSGWERRRAYQAVLDWPGR